MFASVVGPNCVLDHLALLNVECFLDENMDMIRTFGSALFFYYYSLMLSSLIGTVDCWWIDILDSVLRPIDLLPCLTMTWFLCPCHSYLSSPSLFFPQYSYGISDSWTLMQLLYFWRFLMKIEQFQTWH